MRLATKGSTRESLRRELWKERAVASAHMLARINAMAVATNAIHLSIEPVPYFLETLSTFSYGQEISCGVPYRQHRGGDAVSLQRIIVLPSSPQPDILQ